MEGEEGESETQREKEKRGIRGKLYKEWENKRTQG